jgi:alpha-galactosidase
MLWDCVGQDNQKWSFMSDGTVRGFGGKCLSTNGNTSANGTGLVLWDCIDQVNQKWTAPTPPPSKVIIRR